ncbi:uncharacterized protein PGTG_21517 [Puccinia graminis f. sp. tritici CRL 75-36-700-3]|uniref:Uncharacterized protein n=1 Tax=Puccinia graminis f. sp. tritici (strain CRL 75-36-700-3 / race SCCL) TaxID=418459 RepID=H6QRJ3_PUCGT|nr:uncharacterized protein PGTG_21517 [Puccinia graminis f. sp. tritici CRL 75-36-700-3]EHS63301.1 hypothetical protein PGTG_21517 [Puccinia graminis f. sp. tritici CRL 75-36-700-3]
MEMHVVSAIEFPDTSPMILDYLLPLIIMIINDPEETISLGRLMGPSPDQPPPMVHSPLSLRLILDLKLFSHITTLILLLGMRWS